MQQKEFAALETALKNEQEKLNQREMAHLTNLAHVSTEHHENVRLLHREKLAKFREKGAVLLANAHTRLQKKRSLQLLRSWNSNLNVFKLRQREASQARSLMELGEARNAHENFKLEMRQNEASMQERFTRFVRSCCALSTDACLIWVHFG